MSVAGSSFNIDYGTLISPQKSYLKLNTQDSYIGKGFSDDGLPSYESYRKSDEQLAAIKDKAVRRFYTNQNEILDMYKECDELLEDIKPQGPSGAHGTLIIS